MFSAVSTVSRRPSDAWNTATGFPFAQFPDLNRETKTLVSKASSWPVLCGVILALRQEGRRGMNAQVRKAAKEQLKIGVGLKHLARDLGLNVTTVRRQVRRLEELGLVVTHRPNVTHTTDPATGQIVTKSDGRCENTTIFLTITPEHLRPTKKSTGAQCAPPPCVSRAHNAPTVRELGIQRAPDGGASGVGTPPAAAAAGLPAGETGGHSAAGTGRLAAAGQEGTSVVPVTAGRDEPVLPAGRLLPTPKTTPRRQAAGRHFGQEPTARSAEEASRDWHRRDPEADRRREEYLASKAAKRPTEDRPPAEAPVRPQEPEPARPAVSDTYDFEAARQAALAALRGVKS